MSSNIDDDFDWAAAVAEIDKACFRHVAAENGGGAEASSTQSRSLQQRTLDFFVQGGGVRQSSNVTKDRTQHGTGGALDSSRQWGGNQKTSGTDFSSREVCPDDAEASPSGCHLPLDYDAAKVWIYPANVPRRSYQFNITKSALFSNTLVCLPTGLGKTLIAAVVMFNYFRWFPTGKIVFTAPSRPLVVQQIEACHKVTGIPQHMTIDMTGQMNPQIRAEHWQSKRVFFVTPQVLEKDIQAGRAATKNIVCLVVDEAHRATGNYSYCVVVRELLAAKVEPRILALTATPGSKQITIQAVVDNLQISSLEYRDENDPDVSQYTHSRKIQLIEVPMNAEATQVKDVFMEVLQPIVHRLCYLGVFYGRDISKMICFLDKLDSGLLLKSLVSNVQLTPYEFLTARDKFRQEPPQNLQQSKYHEVENYFGLAMTLFHVFKLLITHGMRPAFEMLRQKLEHGILKRLAKNEKLLQVQNLMKQSIGHGAPSPKLDKVVDIVNDHFRLHDAASTRVIIFTNFRESVKDIMDKLAVSCDSVKAMEFIGQSSGKTSKGQTQKTQQAVLQRFRGGCYNTIVATSIAEEGLDIMEVDLVICFDANISPLRMIQRMGRTGRKRDGRVVVLASSGSEVQGYLKKQSKSKALGKHMLNGGLQSFNFHASHHMIPHSLRTSVQLLELSIEDFVPRGRKQKEKDPTAGGPRKLTEKELKKVQAIQAIPDLTPLEDRVNKFFASPVYQVKHSKRSCLLMDCLQTLGIRPQSTTKEGISTDKVISHSPIELPVESNIPPRIRESHLPSSPFYDNCSDDDGPDVDPKMLDNLIPRDLLASSPASSPYPWMIVKAYPEDLPSPEEVLFEQRHHEEFDSRNTGTRMIVDGLDWTNKVVPHFEHDGQDDGDFDRLESAHLSTTNKGLTADHMLPGTYWMAVGDRKANVVSQAAHQHRSFKTSDHPDLDYFESPDQLRGTGFHRCQNSADAVSATQSGVVLINSPSSLLLPKKPTDNGSPKPFDQSDKSRANSKTLQQREAQGNNLNEQRQATGSSPRPKTLANHSSDNGTPFYHLAKSLHTIEFVEATPDEKDVGSPSSEARLLKETVQARVLCFEELSPRLAEFANHGVVPSTPGKERTPISGQASILFDLGTVSTEGRPYLPSDCKIHIPNIRSPSNILKPPRNSISPLPSSSLATDKDVYSQRRSQKQLGLPSVSDFAHPVEDVSPKPRILLKVRPLTFDSPRSEELPVPNQNSPGVNNGNDPSEQAAGNLSKANAKSPLQIQSSKSSGEDWQINEGEASASVQKPRQLKRLCRAREKLPISLVEESSKRSHNRSVQEVRNQVKDSRAGTAHQHQKQLAAKAFIDEEAEVSSDDEDDSLSEDDDHEDEEDSSLEGFIDTAGTQHLNGSVDMINIYRKSLLTPSPLGYLGGKQIDLRQWNSTASSDVSPSSIEPSSATRGLEDLSDFSAAPSIRKSSFVSRQNTMQTTRVMDPDTDSVVGEGKLREAIAANIALGTEVERPEDQDRNKAEFRKRKLSFQSSSSYDDDIFDGVDLDALEAEATEISRMRSQAQVICSNAPQEQVVPRTGSLPSRFHKDTEFQFMPSFDLGLGD